MKGVSKDDRREEVVYQMSIESIRRMLLRSVFLRKEEGITR